MSAEVRPKGESEPRAVDRGTARRQAFLTAARTVFLEQGYEAASVNDVVRLAGGSLATLYSQFGNKEGLFLAVLQDQYERTIVAMTPESVDNLSMEIGLQKIGENFLRTILMREQLGFFRLTVSEGRKFPETAVRYVSAGADKVRDVVANHIRATCPTCEDADRAASFFLELVRSRHQYRALANDDYQPDEAEIRAHVASAISVLKHGALSARV